MFYTYAIRSTKHKYIYAGLTNNPDRRIKQHNDGRSKATKYYKPFKVILLEEHRTRIEARKREKYLKSGIGKEFLKNLQ